jgi:AcrR family transcriptional regulator
MATPSPSPLRAAPLQPADWIRAAFARLSVDGIEAVRVEVLARDLNVSKGSFYWHFRNREDLLDKLQTRWEEDEVEWLEHTTIECRSAALRWARFAERSADPSRIGTEAAIREWARRDERVARRIAVIEKKRTRYIKNVLVHVGFAEEAAEEWSDIAFLIVLGWVDRTTRDAEFRMAGRGLGEFLSELVLAASAHTAGRLR